MRTGRYRRWRVRTTLRPASFSPGGGSCWRRRSKAMAARAIGAIRVLCRFEIASSAVAAGAPAAASHINIHFPSGIVVSTGRDIEVEPLRRVLTALANR